jgi:hypothetical protein
MPDQLSQNDSAHHSGFVQYLKRVLATFVATAAISFVGDAISKVDVARINSEVVEAVRRFDFPAVIHSTLQLSYTTDHANCQWDSFLRKTVCPERFSWGRFLLSPLTAWGQAIKLLVSSWEQGFISFLTVVMAFLVGCSLTAPVLVRPSAPPSWRRRLRRESDSTGAWCWVIWCAPFVGSAFLWALQWVMVAAFVVLGKLLVGVQTIVAISATFPLLYHAIEGEREHAFASWLDRWAEKVFS